MSGEHRHVKMGAMMGVLLSLMLALTPAVIAQSGDEVPYEIRIGIEHYVRLGTSITIPVTKTAGSEPMSGFDFLIGYYANVMSLQLAQPESIGDTYAWEYFTYRTSDDIYCGNDCETVRIVALANVNDGVEHAFSDSVADGSELFSLGFLITSDAYFADMFVPLEFCWGDCGDNTIAYGTETDQRLGLSQSVYSVTSENDEYSEITDVDYEGGFPTKFGVLDECLEGVPSTTSRFIDFYNGGVEIISDEEVPFAIKIGRMYDIELGSSVSVPVTKTAGSEPMAGFDFLVGYDASVLNFQSAQSEDIADVYEWEYFTYRIGPSGECDPVPISGMVRVVALADVNNGVEHNYSDRIADGSTLFSLDFLVTSDLAYECYFLPIEFWWCDCGDNTIAYGTETDQRLAISQRIYSYDYGVDITDEDYEGGFPTKFGALNECLDGVPSTTSRFVDFYNGGFDIHCIDDIDDRGDVNLNGIANEIADWVTFTNYLLYGPSAFTINFNAQYQATDINADGIFATINDLVYLTAVIRGDALPYPEPPTKSDPKGANSINWTATDSSLICTGNFTDSLGGMYLKFYAPDLADTADYEIMVSPGADSMRITSAVHDDSLFILAVSPLSSDTLNCFLPGMYVLFEIVYTDRIPLLSHASAAGRFGQYLDFSVDATPHLPPQFAAYPTALYNDNDGAFYWDFDADDPNGYPELVTFEIISGAGKINPETGVWNDYPYCAEIGESYTLELCAGYPYFPCETSDPVLHAVVNLTISQMVSHTGDADNDGDIELTDIWYLINYLYMNGLDPVPGPEALDVNQDGLVNLNDALYLIDYLYMFGPEPLCP